MNRKELVMLCDLMVALALLIMSGILYYVSYIALFDYPSVVIASSIWGSASLISGIYLYSKIGENKK